MAIDPDAFDAAMRELGLEDVTLAKEDAADAIGAYLRHLKREYSDQDIETILKISNAAIRRNGVMKDALKAIAANPYAHSEDVNCAKNALTKIEQDHTNAL